MSAYNTNVRSKKLNVTIGLFGYSKFSKLFFKVLDKVVKKNPKYSHIESNIDTGV